MGRTTTAVTVGVGKNMTKLLKQGTVILGRLVETEYDMFWVDATFEPTDAFVSYKPLFEEEYQALEAGDMDTVERLQDKISALGLRLVDEVDGRDAIDEFMLHIHDDEARFRT